MIITKMALPRRTFLRGLGAALALPLLDAMVPAFSTTVRGAAKPACRSGVRLCPERRRDERRRQLLDAEGHGHRLRVVADPLAARAVPRSADVVSGLAQKQAESLGDGNGEHTRACATWLNGVHPKKTEGADIRRRRPPIRLPRRSSAKRPCCRRSS